MAAYRAITETCKRRYTHPDSQDWQWCDEVLAGDKQLMSSLFQSCTSDSGLKRGVQTQASQDRVLKSWLARHAAAAFVVSFVVHRGRKS